jgi:SAM-dependent methyltransferase
MREVANGKAAVGDDFDGASELEASAAVERLVAAVEEFRALESRTWFAREQTHHAALACVHQLCACILECEEAGLTRDDIVTFLEPVRAIHRRSPFVSRLQEWPRKYPGDFETVEYIMNARNGAPENTLEWHCEEYSLNFSIAQQHRNKVQHQAERILRTLSASRTPTILALACGSVPDVRKLLPMLLRSDARIVLNDADPAALAFAAEALCELGDRCEFVEGNALMVMRDLARMGHFDLVLAGGLFDYLKDRPASFLIHNVVSRLLRPDGSFFFTNIARGNPWRPLIEYFGDWFLIERSREQIEDLCLAAGISSRGIEISRDSTGLALLVDVYRTPS